MITMVYVNIEEGVKPATMEHPDLPELYRLLNCDCIDITSRKIGKHYYDIICDDDGLLKDSPTVTAIDVKTCRPMLVGNLLITKHNVEGENVGLTEKQVKEIMSARCTFIHNMRTVEGLEMSY